MRYQKASPRFQAQRSHCLVLELRNWMNEGDDGFDSFYRLVCGILGKAPGESPRTKFTARDVWDWQE